MAEKAKVTIRDPGDTPSTQATAAARKEVTVTDSAGRTLTLKKPPFTAQVDLVAMLGDKARNSMYHTMVTPITYLHAIDGEPVLRPGTERELRALIERLDEHGYMALVEGITEHFSAGSVPANEDKLKNS